jgi:hypothetical protein
VVAVLLLGLAVVGAVPVDIGLLLAHLVVEHQPSLL